MREQENQLLLGIWSISYLRLPIRAVLMAPTGRAAKVMSGYAGKKAFTIHKQIYFTKNEGGSGMKFTLKPNKFKTHSLCCGRSLHDWR